jgi:hypothetical protein
MKITLNKEEEIQLTEREEEIYNKGFEDGNLRFNWREFTIGFMVAVCVAVILINILI